MKTSLPLWLPLAVWLGSLPAQAAPAIDPWVVGTWSAPTGEVRSVTIQGTYAYVAFSEGVAALDLTEPAVPVEIDSFETTADPIQVFVSENHAYVHAYDYDTSTYVLEILDIGDPTSIAAAGVVSNIGEIAFVSGNRAYWIDQPNNRMHIVDVGDPSNPQPAGTYPSARTLLNDLYVSGDHAWLYAYQSVPDWQGFEVVDVSDPANPQLVNELGPDYRTVFVADNRAYVGAEDEVHIYDMSSPTSPIPLVRYPGMNLEVVEVFGESALAHANSGFEIIDLSNPSQPEQTGWIPGPDAEVAVRGQYAYMADGDLIVYDLSRVAQPNLLGAYRPTISFNRDIHTVGGRAYLATGASGLRIVDVTNPQAPQLLGEQAPFAFGSAEGVFVTGSLACVAEGSTGLQIYDVTDPTAPQRLGGFNTGGLATHVAVAGGYAYVLDNPTGLHVIDISAPANPQRVSGYALLDPGRDLFVSENLAFVPNIVVRTALHIFDISNPTNIQLRLGGASGIYGDTGAAADGYAILGYGNDIEMYDVGDPTNPMMTDSLSLGSSFAELAVLGTHVYAAGWNLEVVDIANPHNISSLGSYALSPQGSVAISIAAPYAYIAEYGDGIQIWDLSNPATPQFVSRFDEVDNVAREVGVAGDTAVLMWADGSVLEALDVSDRANPQHVSRFVTSEYDDPWNETAVHVVGNRAYVADGFAGLHIIDISDPAHMERLGGYDTTGYVFQIFVSGDYAYLAEWFDLSQLDLLIIDVSDPAAPVPVATFDTPGFVNDVVVQGDRAYVGDGFAGLQILDVSNPAAPWLIGGATIGSGYHLTVEGDYAYLAAGTDGMHIVDVGDPAHPQWLSTFDPDGFITDIAAAGSIAYVADTIGGLHVVDVSDPAAPVRVAGNSVVGGVGGSSLTLAGSYLFYATGTDGLFIFELHQPADAIWLESLAGQAPGTFRFLLHGPSGKTGEVQRTGNLQSWSNWMPFTLGDVPLEITDPSAGLNDVQFYRAVSP